MKPTEEQIQLQIARELGYYEQGRDAYHKNKQRLLESGQASKTKAAQAIMFRSMEKYIAAVDAMVYPEKAKTGKVPACQSLLKGSCPDKIAFLALSAILDGMGQCPNLTIVARNVGRAIEMEMRLQAWLDGDDSGVAKKMIKKANEKSAYYLKVIGLVHKMNHDKVEHKRWSEAEVLQVGYRLISILIETLGLFELKYQSLGMNKTVAYLGTTEETNKWIEGFDSYQEYKSPRYAPSLIEPKEWTDTFGGGLYNEVHEPLTFLKHFRASAATKDKEACKTEKEKYFNSISKKSVKPILDCLNNLQKTKWTINKEVMDVLIHTWEHEWQVGSLPNRRDIELPKYPFGDRSKDVLTEAELVNYKAFCAERSKVHQANVASMSKRISIESTLKIAKEYANHEEFYFIWNCDFRGRYYPVANVLNPQAAEWGRALLQFKNGMAINNAEELEWLCIHGANTAGQDKVSMTDRVRWVYDHSDEICRVAADPLEFLWWTDMDKPFLFLAFCFEWSRFVKEGFGFISHLPVYCDGTANGIQHLSAILRDEKGGRSVNLCRSEKPNDLYANVAEAATETLRRIVVTSDEPEKVHMATEWLAYGLTRKITKRAVMIVPYNGTPQGVKKYIEEAYLEGLDSGKKKLNIENKWMAYSFLTSVVWEAIHEVVKSSKVVMDYIKAIAKLYASKGQYFNWVVPTGLKVQPLYFDKTKKRIETKIAGHLGSYLMLEDNEKVLDTTSSVRASSPNLIHSLDAAAMTFTINTCANEGMADFAFIHDAYGTHSANMPKLGRILRESFAEMHMQHNVMKELHDKAVKDLGLTAEQVPAAPEQGTLDLYEVMDSEYFFS